MAPRLKTARKVRIAKTFLEFFAGIGLVREGLEPSGWQCIYANDNDPKKRALYNSRFSDLDHFHEEDIRRTKAVTSHIHGSPFLATASFPCTDLSVAGKYLGFKGTESSTFFAFAEALKALGRRRPKVVMLENVAGFLTSHKGEDFRQATATLASLGYWLDAFLLNASHFTPQSRPRVFVVGVSKTLKPSEVGSHGTLFPCRSGLLTNDNLDRHMRTIDLPTGWVTFPLPEPPVRTRCLEDVIDLDLAQDWWDDANVQAHLDMMHERHRRLIKGYLADQTTWVGTVFRRTREKKVRAEVRFDGLAGCLRTPSGGSANQIVIATHGGTLRMRWMTPREYARLQGADDFPLEGTRVDLLWGLADAVCVPGISWIDRHLLTPLYDRYRDL